MVAGVGDNESKKITNNNDNKNPSRRIPILNPGLFSSKAPAILVVILWWMVYFRLIKGREIWECILITHMSTLISIIWVIHIPILLLRSWCSKCATQSSNISRTRELVRNTNSLCSQTYWIKNSLGGSGFSNMYFNQSSRWFWYALKLENYTSTLTH